MENPTKNCRYYNPYFYHINYYIWLIFKLRYLLTGLVRKGPVAFV